MLKIKENVCLCDYKIKKINIFEKIILLFVKPTKIIDSEGNIVGKCKKFFGKSYTNEYSVRR